MINRILDLTNKQDEFERYIINFESLQKKSAKKTTCLSFLKNYSNLEVILPKKLTLANFNGIEKSSVFIQCLIEITLPFSEEVEFSFIINDIAVQKSKKKLQDGSNQISIMHTFVPITNGDVSVCIEISPLNQRIVNLNMASLYIWGDFEKQQENQYQIIETNDKYLISMLENKSIYYLYSEKLTNEFAFVDFNYYDQAKDYCFVYSKNKDIVYLFKIDLNGNLFYLDFLNKNEIFITDNVSKVSADISSNDKIVVSYIKDNSCFYFEIFENNISVHKKLYFNNVIANCYTYFNKYREKFCLIFTAKNETNYFIEEICETDSKIDNISASYSISIDLISS